MYERPHYSVDSAAALSLVASNPIALLVTSNDGHVAGAHVPVLFYRGPQGQTAEGIMADAAPLEGSLLVGHMNINNPQWRSMRRGDRALIVFQGPHGYVSPAIYGVTPSAPTWDFTAVHLTGTLSPSAEYEDVVTIVTETARRLELAFGQGWQHDASAEYIARIARGVGAFQMRVDSVETMFKLSQEQSPVLRERVAKHFGNSESVTHRALAHLIRIHSNRRNRT
ncbi:FMN-binding negative transcriptional regulator [Mycolicibacterium neoaurum]|uniref:FMN-binding negative transcriptional regulator n=1 Tax=Mycolicibacterium neoaurum TaxID=1795 RepID=UPI001F4C717B|nr:FMN-binding negative transcriptional regulator [Mycolicibacterium neoaurum]